MMQKFSQEQTVNAFLVYLRNLIHLSESIKQDLSGEQIYHHQIQWSIKIHDYKIRKQVGKKTTLTDIGDDV